MKFIKLHTLSGPFWANPNHITNVVPVSSEKDRERGYNAAVLALGFDDSWLVKETPEEVVRMIDEALASPPPPLPAYPGFPYVPPVSSETPSTHPWYRAPNFGTVSAAVPPTPGLEVPATSFISPSRQQP